MDQTILAAILQGIVQIVTIIGTIWAMFNRQTQYLESRLDARIDKIESKFGTKKDQMYK